MSPLEFEKQGLGATKTYTVSSLTNSFKNVKLVVPGQGGRRRSSVLRRMSVGHQMDATPKIKLGTQPLETQVFDDESSDEELYKRSNSNRSYKIGDFQPLKVLGQGAYGKVLLVKNKYNGKLFAQKELKKASVIMDNKNVERTFSERTILSKITSHPNIVKLFYALHDHYKLYLLMEYIPGGELFRYLVHEKFLNEKKTSFYIIQMSMALKFLHEFGIVYRDLKPENCLLDRDGYLILTDFGLAKKSTQDNNSSNWCNSVIGTPEYCAPEILKGENYGTLSDWWSLGCVAFDLLTGNPPFTGNNHKQIMDRVLREKPKYPFYVSGTSKELLNKLLVRDPNKRYNVDSNWDKFQKFQFFRYYNFEDVENRVVEPPIKPKITNLEMAENFDDEFTSLKISDLNEPVDIKNEATVDDAFLGFSYTASNSLIDSYL
ncbi:Serine/threonine-protein kinase psk1 [Pichia kudriavzevii]|uniref:Serine/threonine-protein kinase psk1 n=1 Tax=Pichia kudriavzevii TaxID=4909 RepID=A0A1V2LJ48_PICKU|nr:Serine/threonine-protein kinase psk1 [Pichia kudriavzevii]